MKYLVGIDIGTSGTKSVLFDIKGNVIVSATKEYPIYQRQNGWAEQDPHEWWEAARETLDKVMANADGEICGIGISGQMHGLVMLDENDEVIRDAIIWCDGRTADECREIEKIVGHDRLIEITANPALAGFTASKIMWVKKHEPENYKKCRHILLPKDYIRFKLTGEYATDVSDASGMQLLDVKNRCWSDEILDKLGIDKRLLPKVYESPEVTGYYKNIPVAGGGGDNACSAVGCGTVRNGRAFTTIGTSGVVFAHTDEMMIDKGGRVHTFCCAVPGKWHVMGVTQAAGLSLKWFKNNFADELSYKEIDEIAKEVPIGAERLIFLPYLMGERTPHLDENARGMFFGISAIHEKKHFLRAIMEGVSYSLRDCMEVLKEMGIPCSDMTACGGGASSDLWRKILAGCYDISIKTLKSNEGAAFGAAILAGVASGVYKSVEDACDELIKPDQVCTPENTEAYNAVYNIYREIYPSVKKLYKRLDNI